LDERGESSKMSSLILIAELMPSCHEEE